VIARQPLLLLVSKKSLLSILTPARDVRGLPKRLPEAVAARLRRLGIDEAVVAAEVGAMSAVVVGETTDRSVTGQMVDFAKHLTYCLPDNSWNEWDLHAGRKDDKTPSLRVQQNGPPRLPCCRGGPRANAQVMRILQVSSSL
jgi:hypothetical protein